MRVEVVGFAFRFFQNDVNGTPPLAHSGFEVAYEYSTRLAASGTFGRIWLVPSVAADEDAHFRGCAEQLIFLGDFVRGDLHLVGRGRHGFVEREREVDERRAVASAPGARTTFFGTSLAGSATFTNQGARTGDFGATDFRGSANAQTAAFFDGASLAAGAFGGRTRFFESSRPGQRDFR